MSSELLKVERNGPLAMLTLADPARRNVLSRRMLAALRDAFGVLEAEPGVRAIVLAAEGPAFSAGHDLAELVDADQDAAREIFALCTEVIERVRLAPAPVIAQVQGIATAAGCQLAATCDLVVASEAAAFATPGVKIGLFCTTPGVALARAVPAKVALEMLLTGTPITAHEARQFGLVNRVVPAERLADETLALARQIASASGDTLRRGKRAFYEQLGLDHRAAYRLAQCEMVANTATPDAREGMRAFLEKRVPQWRE